MADLWISRCAFSAVVLVLFRLPLTTLMVFLSRLLKLFPACMFYYMIDMVFWIQSCTFSSLPIRLFGVRASVVVRRVVWPLCSCCSSSRFYGCVQWPLTPTPSFSLWFAGLFFLFSSGSFLLTCFVPLSVGHSGYWHVFNASWVYFSSNALSTGSVIIVVRTTEGLCLVGCSDIQKISWSVCPGFLWVFILMPLLSVCSIFYL